MVLKDDEAKNITGGGSGSKLGIGIILAALGSFIVGIIDGYLRPLKCNS